ncbi:hypothetical protein 1 [Beihai picorna-like virus 114]|uniref:hypothetical protein 1 n=1 Tax=Beihai picorna-like virus 114 TaxID=1922543 RepID=UPI00090CA120|nr:hypothetical protein 1 [Beihai picorna-like virus 114]APG78958.1 hypothetical protein 1 [Beihai picorna-like virus 114]
MSLSTLKPQSTLFTTEIDYKITGLGLSTWTYENGTRIYFDQYEEEPEILVEKEVYKLLPKIRARKTQNLRFTEPKVETLLLQIRDKCQQKFWNFFESYATILAELYPTEDIYNILTQELTACLSTKGISVGQMFENFFTLMLKARPTEEQTLMILDILPPDDVRKINQLYGILGLLTGPDAEEQMFSFFTNASTFMDNAAKSSEDWKKTSATINNTLDGLTAKIESIVSSVKDTLRPDGPTIETLGSIGRIFLASSQNLPYILGKISLMVYNGCSLERFVDLLSATGALGVLIEKLGSKLTNLLFAADAEEQMDFSKLAKLLFTPDGLMNFWKVDRGILGITTLLGYLKTLLVQLGIVTDKHKEEVVRLSHELDNLEQILLNYQLKLTNDPRSLLDPNHLRVLESHVQTLQQIYSNLEIINDLTHRQRCALLKRDMTKVMTTVMTMQRQAHSRVEPLGICTLGAGGIGKSTLISSTPGLIARRVKERCSLPSTNPQHLPHSEFLDSVPHWKSWSQNQTDKYYSGYIGQEYHNVDDGFQDQKDLDHLAYFNLISAVPFPTNQAELESKGRPYCSRIVQVSANRFPTRSETIRDIRALARRFTLVGVRFNGNDAQYRAWLTGNRDHDNTFSHLQFFKMSGYTYVTRQQDVHEIGQGLWQQINLTQYLDLIIDGVVAKQNIFMQRVYAEEQAGDTNIVDMNPWNMYYGNYNGARTCNFVTPEGRPVMDVKPVDGNFKRSMLVARFGSFPAKEFQTDWDINRVINSVNTDHPKHIGRVFKSTEPTSFEYRHNGTLYHIHFPKMGDGFNATDVRCFDTTYREEDYTQYHGQFTEGTDDSLFGRLKAFFMKLFNGCKDMVVWVLYVLKAIFFPDMTGWTTFQRCTQHAIQGYYFLLIALTTFAYFFGVQMLGSISTCVDCMTDMQKNYDLLIHWALVNKYHQTFCKFYRCHDDCRWLKSVRFPGTKGCKNEVGSLFWKTKCGYHYNQENILRLHKILEKLHNQDPASAGPDAMGAFIVESCRLSETELGSWIAQAEYTYLNCFLAPTTYTNVTEEGDNLKQFNTFLIHPEHFERDSNKEIIRSMPSEESGESKRIVRSRATMQSGESKRIIRRHARVESALTQKRIPCSDGSSATAHKRLPGLCVDQQTFAEVESNLDKKPLTAEQVAEEYGLKLNKINPEPIAMTESNAQTEEEASVDENCRTQAGSINESAIYVLRPDGRVLVRGIPVSQSHFVLPAHTTQQYPVGETFSIAYKGGNYAAKIEKARPRWDIAIARVTGVTLQSKRKFIPKESELIDRLRSNSRGVICIPNQDKTTYMLNVNMILHKEHRITFKNLETKEYDHLWVATNLVSSGADTVKGDCGSPVMLMCPKTHKKLVGFHIVGASDFSAFAVLTDERIEMLLEDADEEGFVDAEEEMNIGKTTYPVIPNSLYETISPCGEDPIYAPVGLEKQVIGTRAFETPSNGKSAINKHPCHGAFPVDTCPAFLSMGAYNKAHPEEPLTMVNPAGDEVEINLVTKNTSKWCKQLPQDPLITEELEEMEEELTEYWKDIFSEENLSMISIEDALSGNPAFDLEPMNVKSSPGIPYNTMKGGTSKQGLIEPTGILYPNGKCQVKPVEEVQKATLNRITLARKGLRPFSLWKDCLKDETRPIPKVHQGKTRIFTAAPFDFSLAVRIMMGRFKAAWQKKGIELGHSVGTDCLSPDWGRLYNKLVSVSNYGFDCDYSSYDGNLRADFMFAAIRIFAKVIAEQTYQTKYDVQPDEVEEIIKVICSECVETFQQSGDVVWQSQHGNPSGNPLTTELNCTVNFMYHWFCFRQILGKENCSLRDFLSEIGFSCFGDDAVFVFRAVDTVTFQKLAYWMNFLGQEYTNAAKTGSESALLHISELSFLKRRFLPSEASNRIIMSPIEESSILGQFNWCSYPADSVDILQDTYENALIEMSQLGVEKFENFVRLLHPRMNRHLKSLTGLNTPKPSYRGYRAKLIHKLTK